MVRRQHLTGVNTTSRLTDQLANERTAPTSIVLYRQTDQLANETSTYLHSLVQKGVHQRGVSVLQRGGHHWCSKVKEKATFLMKWCYMSPAIPPPISTAPYPRDNLSYSTCTVSILPSGLCPLSPVLSTPAQHMGWMQ